MSKHELFEQVDFRPTSVSPGGSTFSANMPVDLRIEEINRAVTKTIPQNLDTAFDANNDHYEYFRSIEPTPTLRLVREATLFDPNSLILPHERQADSRRELTLASLAQAGITCTQVFYELVDGRLVEYTVRGRPIQDSTNISDLYGSVNYTNGESDTYAFADNTEGATTEHPLAIGKPIAIDFLAGLAARQNGETPGEDELQLLQQLYLASPEREHYRERVFGVKNEVTGDTVHIDARLSTITKGKQTINSYLVSAAFELPSKDTVSMSVKLDPPKKNNRLYPSANMTMAILDHPDTLASSPEDKANTFETILRMYREKPEHFFGTIDNAVRWLAEAEPLDDF